MLKKITMTAVLISLLFLTACNTLHGFGKDVESAGEAIKRAADK